MAPNEFELLKAFISVDTRGARLSLASLSRDISRLERQISTFGSRRARVDLIVTRRARRQINTLIRRLREAANLSQQVRVSSLFVGGARGFAGGVASGAAVRRFTGVGGGRIAQAATFGLLAGNLRGQVSGAAQAGILGTATGGIGLGAGLLAGVGGAVIVRRSTQVAADFESIEVALQGIIKDENKVRRLLRDLRDVSLETSTNLFTDLLPSSIGLLGSGFAPEEIPALQKQLADLAVITEKNGVTFAELSSKVARNATQFRQTTRDVREYTNAGLNILPSLQRQLGVFTNEEVFEQIEKGRVTIVEILQAINDLTGEGGVAFQLQARAASTLNFQLQKLGENVTFLAKEIGDELVPVASRATVALNELFVDRPTPPSEQSREALETVVTRSREEAQLIRRQRKLQDEVAALEDEAAKASTRTLRFLQESAANAPLRLRQFFGEDIPESAFFRQPDIRPDPERIGILRTQIEELQREIINVRLGDQLIGPTGEVTNVRIFKRAASRLPAQLNEAFRAGAFRDVTRQGIQTGAAAGLGFTLGGASTALQFGLRAAGLDTSTEAIREQAKELAKRREEGELRFFNAAEFALFKELPPAAQVQSAATKSFERAVQVFSRAVSNLDVEQTQATILKIQIERAGQ